MSLSGPGHGGSPKRPGAGKSIKGYPKASGADDATIDVRKNQKPSAELPPSPEPTIEPSLVPAEPVESVEPESADPVPQGAVGMESSSDGSPSSTEAPSADDGRDWDALPLAAEVHRAPAKPQQEFPNWTDVPESNASVVGAEFVPRLADTAVGETQERADESISVTAARAVDGIGSRDLQSDGTQGLNSSSIGEARAPLAEPSAQVAARFGEKSFNAGDASAAERDAGERRGASRSDHQSDQSPPIEIGRVPRVENQGSGAAAKEQATLETPSADITSDVGFPLELRKGEVERPPVADTLTSAPMPSVEFGWGEFGRGDFGKRIRDRAGQTGRILQVKHGIVTARADTGRTFPVRQEGARLVDDQGNDLRKPVGASVRVNPSDGRNRKRNHRLVGHQANLIANDGDPGVDRHGFKITKNFDEYLRMIEQTTKSQWHPEQQDGLMAIAAGQPFLRLDSKALHAHSSKFTHEAKNELIAEWEKKTGKKWPRYAEDIPDSEGKVLRRKDDPYDAHHIIPKNYGGPHRWENLIPARHPNEHQGGIHRSLIFRLLFP